MTPKETWKSLKAKVDKVEAERARLVAPTNAALEAASEALELFEEECGEVIARCEGCMDPIFEGDPYHGAVDDCVYTCKKCSPTYKDILNNPAWFQGAEGDPMTPEQARLFVDNHLAAGGAVSDSLAS